MKESGRKETEMKWREEARDGVGEGLAGIHAVTVGRCETVVDEGNISQRYWSLEAKQAERMLIVDNCSIKCVLPFNEVHVTDT